MAVTITVAEKGSTRDGHYTYADVVGPASYTTGGELLTAAQVNQLMPNLGGGLVLTDLAKAQFIESEINATGYQCSIDKPNGKMMFWLGPQVAGATNLSTATVRIRVKYGKVNLG